MTKRTLVLLLTVYLLSSDAFGQIRITIGTPRITVRAPEIRVGSKPLDEFTGAVKQALDGAGKIIPEELQKLSTKFVGEAGKLSGDLIEVYRGNQSLIGNITVQGFNILEEITNPVSENLAKLKDGSLNAIGVTLPPEIDKALDDYIAANKNGLQELRTIYEKTMALQDGVLEGAAIGIKEFSRYLLLTANGFPAMLSGSELPARDGSAGVVLNTSIFPSIFKRLLENEVVTGTGNHDKPFQVIAVSSGSLNFHQATNTLILEINDAKIRHNQPVENYTRLSGTLNVRKLKLQLIPVQSQEGEVFFKMRLLFLDIEDLLPKLDEMLCWVLEDVAISKMKLPLPIPDIINSTLKIKKSDVDQITLTTAGFEKSIFLEPNAFGIIYKVPESSAELIPQANGTLSFSFNADFMKSLVNNALKPTNGIRIVMRKKYNEFKPNRNHYYLKKINSISFLPDSTLYLGAEASVHIRRFLGNKPKINVLFSNVGFRLVPVVNQDSIEASISLQLVPVLDSLRSTGAPVKTTVLRKIGRLFRQTRTPIKLRSLDASSIKTFNFSHPLDPDLKLLPTGRSIQLQKGKDVWSFSVNMQER